MAFLNLGILTSCCRVTGNLKISEEWHLYHLKLFQMLPFLDMDVRGGCDRMRYLILQEYQGVIASKNISPNGVYQLTLSETPWTVLGTSQSKVMVLTFKELMGRRHTAHMFTLAVFFFRRWGRWDCCFVVGWRMKGDRELGYIDLCGTGNALLTCIKLGWKNGYWEWGSRTDCSGLGCVLGEGQDSWGWRNGWRQVWCSNIR